MLVLFLIFTIILFIIYKTNIIKNKYIQTFIKYFSYALLISLVLETTIFNYRHYESLIFKNNTKVDFKLITEEKSTYIEIKNINKKVNNIYLDITSPEKLGLKTTIFLTDEANNLYYKAGTHTYLNFIKNSNYIRIHTSGKSNNIKIEIKPINVSDKTKSKINKNFKINEIKINEKVPILINNVRLILCFIISLVLLIVFKKSNLYDIKFNSKKAKLLYLILIILSSIAVIKISTYNKYTNSVTQMNYNLSQYKNLAEALKEKHFYLNLPVSDKLLALDNPYDRNLRNSELEAGKDYYWDYAFYNNKYYSYFGVVPCLLTYLPYFLITGSHLPNNIGVSLSVIFLIISCFYLLYQIINKYFNKTSMIHYLILTMFLILTSGITLALSDVIFYYIPIIFGISFACLGLGFYLKSTSYDKLKIKYLFLGSLCMALIAGCRPQLLLSSFFAIPIFWKYFKNKELFSKKSLKETLIFIVPFIIIAIFLMYYNYARFNSPFDFGANYNLTTNDMTKRGIVFDRVFLGLYSYLFETARINVIFPFIHGHHIATSYIGITINERMFGGYFFTNIICLLSLFILKFKNMIKNKPLYHIALLSPIFAIIIIIADTQMAGILARYICDFAWLFTLSTIIIILTLLKENKLNKTIKNLIIVLIFLAIVLNILNYLDGNYLYKLNQELFYKLYYMFMFWI